MMQILQQEEMNGLLERALQDEGWSKSPDGTLSKKFGTVTATLSEDRSTVTLSEQRKTQVEASSTSKDGLQKSLDRQQEGAQKGLKQEIAQSLIDAEASAREELQGALQKVYTEALKKKAASMGQIESMQEELSPDGQLELTIKVKV